MCHWFRVLHVSGYFSLFASDDFCAAISAMHEQNREFPQPDCAGLCDSHDRRTKQAMPYGLYISAEGAQGQSDRLDVIANNLANVDTVGFSGAGRYAGQIRRGN